MRSIRLSILAAFLITLSSCSGGPGTRPPTATPASATTQRSFVLDGEPMLPCGPDAAVCGSLTVPEDRSHPEGRQIDLNVRVVPAVASDPAPDPVFFLAGGPGGAATESWWSAPDLFPIVHWDRDIVLVDQRGTGGSNELLWQDTPDLSGLSRHEMSVTLAAWLDQALADSMPTLASTQAPRPPTISTMSGPRSDTTWSTSTAARTERRSPSTTCDSTGRMSGQWCWTGEPCSTSRSSSAYRGAAKRPSTRCSNAARPIPVATRRSPTRPATSSARWLGWRSIRSVPASETRGRTSRSW